MTEYQFYYRKIKQTRKRIKVLQDKLEIYLINLKKARKSHNKTNKRYRDKKRLSQSPQKEKEVDKHD